MFFVGQSNDSINFLPGWIKYTVIVINPLLHTHTPPSKLQGGWWWLDQPCTGRSCRTHLPTTHWSHGMGGGGGCCYIVHLYGASYVTMAQLGVGVGVGVLLHLNIYMVPVMSQSRGCYSLHLYGASYVTISRMLHPTSIIMVSLMSQSLHSLLQ